MYILHITIRSLSWYININTCCNCELGGVGEGVTIGLGLVIIGRGSAPVRGS